MPAVSKAQQKLFAIVKAYKDGKRKDADDKVKDIAANISDKDATDMASTSTKGLPDKVKKEESVDEVAERDYKAEYKKFQSSPAKKKYRAELNKYNRQKGTYGNGDKKDASHKNGKIAGFEEESKNRARAEKSRLKKEYTMNEAEEGWVKIKLSDKQDGKTYPWYIKKHGDSTHMYLNTEPSKSGNTVYHIGQFKQDRPKFYKAVEKWLHGDDIKPNTVFKEGMNEADVFAKHQIAIAKKTLKMSDMGAQAMGGMTKEEAREILKKHNIKFKEGVKPGVNRYEEIKASHPELFEANVDYVHVFSKGGGKYSVMHSTHDNIKAGGQVLKNGMNFGQAKALGTALAKKWKGKVVIDGVEESLREAIRTEIKSIMSEAVWSPQQAAELNKYNRDKGTYGNGDGKDASHKGGKIAGFEAESKNRGRAEKSRLKKEEVLAQILRGIIREELQTINESQD